MDKFIKDVSFERVGSLRDVMNLGEDYNGKLLMFEDPQRDAEYTLGVDVGSGKGLTNSVVHVNKNGTVRYPDEQVAEWAGDFLDPAELAPIIAKIGYMYFCHKMELPALASVEINNHGLLCQHVLHKDLEYPNMFEWKIYDKTNKLITNRMGWETNTRTRPTIIMFGENRLKTGQWIIRSPYFIEEMKRFELVHLLNRSTLDVELLASMGRWEGKKRDDRLMAGFIALWTANDIRPDIALERERLRDIREKAAIIAPDSELDYQNTMTNARQMRDLYNEIVIY